MLKVPWRKRKPGTKDYLDRDELAAEVKKSIDNGRQATDKLASMFLLIVDKIIKSHNFCGYPADLKEEMRSYAQYKFIRSMRTVDLSKAKNIFNYYTRLVWLAFLTSIGKWKKRKEKEIEYLDNYSYQKKKNSKNVNRDR